MTEPTREEIDLVLKAYSKEELARKHCILTNDVLRLEAELKAARAGGAEGEWIYHIDDLFPEDSTQECSHCHEEEKISLENENYCPNCGAKMKGE